MRKKIIKKIKVILSIVLSAIFCVACGGQGVEENNESGYDIIIQAGQSNAEGFGLGDTTETYEPSPDILHMNDKQDFIDFALGATCPDKNGKTVIEEANEHVSAGTFYADFSLTFAKDYVASGRLKTGKKLLIIRAAVGATGFSSGHWKVGDYLYLRMVAMADYALSLDPNNKIVGILWHQGEHDTSTDAAVYQQYLSEMVQSLRGRYGANIPFIAGEFVNEWKMANIEICEPIMNATKEVVKTQQPAAFVETSDLLSNNQQIGNGDTIHFSKDSLYKLGHRYFEAFSKL